MPGLAKSRVAILKLSRCNIGVKAGKAIATMLKTTAITRLDLAHNCISGVDRSHKGTYSVEAFEALCGALKGNTTLIELNLEGVLIRTEGLKLLAAVLKHTKIAHLDLSGTELYGKGFEHDCSGLMELAEVLPQTHLKNLTLKNNLLAEGDLGGGQPSDVKSREEARQAIKAAAGNTIILTF